MPNLHDRMRSIWAFALAASMAPAAYLVAIPCGAVCVSCPLTGACLLTYPAIIGLIFAIKLSRKAKSALLRMAGSLGLVPG